MLYITGSQAWLYIRLLWESLKIYRIPNHTPGEFHSVVWGEIYDIRAFKCSWVDFKGVECGEGSPGASERNTGLESLAGVVGNMYSLGRCFLSSVEELVGGTLQCWPHDKPLLTTMRLKSESVWLLKRPMAVRREDIRKLHALWTIKHLTPK